MNEKKDEKKDEKKKLLLISRIITALSFLAFAILLIPIFNPTRFLPQIKDWSYLHFVQNAMQIDKLFTADFPGIRNFFASNAMATFCGMLIGIFATVQLLSVLLTMSTRLKIKAIGFKLQMIFSFLIICANIVVLAVVISANSSVEKLGFTQLGIKYIFPLGSYLLILIGIAQFILGVLYRKKLLIVSGLYIKMTRSEKIENAKGFAFISPFIIGFFAFTAIPLIFSFFSSFTYYNITAVQKWYGVTNFVRLFTVDPYFWKSLYNTVWYVVVSVPLSIIVALALSLLMNVNYIKGLRFFRTVYYLPSVLSGVAVFLLWQWLLDANAGLVNSFIGIFGIDGPAWLVDPTWTKPALVLMKIWGVGGSTIILLSALQSVPQELYEAGAIDGAAGFKKFFNITLPMISPTLFFVMVTGISGAFQVFDAAYIMFNGEVTPNNSLLFYNLYLFNSAIKDQQMGLASTMAWILFAIIMVFTIIQMIGSKKWVHYEGGTSKK